MDTICIDIWLEIVLLLNTVSAIRLRKTCSFFKFIDKLHFITNIDGITTSIHCGKRHGWSWGADDINRWHERYEKDVIVERYCVTNMGWSYTIQINNSLYEEYEEYEDDDYVAYKCISDSIPQVTILPANIAFCRPQPSGTDCLLAVSPNFLNLRAWPHTASMFVLTVLQESSSYCLNCYDCVPEENLYFNETCCKNRKCVRWGDDHRSILASTKEHRPRTYALLPHD
jgi:hypothetical protein